MQSFKFMEEFYSEIRCIHFGYPAKIKGSQKKLTQLLSPFLLNGWRGGLNFSMMSESQITPRHHLKKKQAGAELGQAQLKLGLDFNQI